MAVCHAPKRHARALTEDGGGIYVPDGVPWTFPQPNTGVMAFSKCSAVKRLLNRWLLNYRKQLQSFPRPGHDQPGLQQALYQEKINFSVLGPEYNLRIPYPSSLSAPVKVLHGRCNSFSQIEFQINRDPHKMRVYIPGLDTFTESKIQEELTGKANSESQLTELYSKYKKKEADALECYKLWKNQEQQTKILSKKYRNLKKQLNPSRTLMNIAFLTNIATSPDKPGGHIHVTQVANNLLQRGHTLYSNISNESDRFVKLSEEEFYICGGEIEAFYIRLHGSPNNDELTRFRAANPAAPCIWEINAPLEELRTHGASEEVIQEKNKRRKDFAKMVDAAVCVSSEMEEYARDFLGIKKTFVVQNGSDPVMFTPEKRENRLYGKAAFTVLWSGSPEYSWQGPLRSQRSLRKT